MQLVKASRDALLKPLQVVSGIVERRQTLPILANILVRKDGERVSFTATDLEIQIQTSADIGAGKVNFSFTDVTRGKTYQNGSYGAMVFVSDVSTSQYGDFDFIVAFNDKGIVKNPMDSDFDDMVMGIKFTSAVAPAIPEPSTYALMALGLLGVAVAARRQRA